MSGDFKADYPEVAARLERLEGIVEDLIETLQARAAARAEAGREASRQIRDALNWFDESTRRVGPRALPEVGDSP